MTPPAILPDPLDVVVAGVGVRIRGTDLLPSSSRHWLACALLPFVAPVSDPSVTIAVTPTTPTPGRRIEHGLALAGDGLWVGDRFGRGAVLDLADGRLHARLHPDAPRWVLSRDVYLFLMRAALARRGAGVLRLAAVQLDGRRVGVTGWSGSGKTRLVLTTLLHHGARLLGDQVVANHPDGTVAALTADMRVRPEHHDLLPGDDRGGGRLRRSLAGWLERLGARTSGRWATKLSAGVAEVLRESGDVTVGAATLAPGRPLGSAGRLHRVVLLRAAPTAPPIDFLLGTQGAYLVLHDAVDGAALATWGATAPLRLPDAARREVLAATLAGVEVVDRPAPLLPPDAAALAAELAR